MKHPELKKEEVKKTTRLEVKGIRFELSNVRESVAKKIKKWCIDNKKTQGEWAETAHNALINKA